MDVECPTCWGWVQKMLADDWFGLTQPKPHPTRIILDLDEPSFAVLEHEAAEHKTPIEIVALVLLQEAAARIAAGKKGRDLAGGHLPADLEERSARRSR